MAEHASFKVGANGIVIRDGCVLLGRRKGGKRSDGFWGLPGGHVEQNELMRDAVLRELKEETGMVATKAVFVNLVNDVRPEHEDHRIQVAFLIEDALGEPKLMEPDSCYEWKWFPLDQLPDDIFMPFLKHLRAYNDKQIFVDGSNLGAGHAARP